MSIRDIDCEGDASFRHSSFLLSLVHISFSLLCIFPSLSCAYIFPSLSCAYYGLLVRGFEIARETSYNRVSNCTEI
jgi:hypothetical protein